MRNGLKSFVSSKEFGTRPLHPFENLGFFVRSLYSLSYLAFSLNSYISRVLFKTDFLDALDQESANLFCKVEDSKYRP